MRRRVWLFGIVLVLVAGALYAAFGGSDADVIAETPLPLDEATIQFVRPTAVGMLDGVRQWELTADRMREHEGLIYLDGIDPGQLFRDGEEYLSFTSDAGVWTRDSDKLELSGHVKVYRDGERLLGSDLLIWDGPNELLTSPGPVEIHHDGNIIRAAEMIGYVADDELLFKGGVEVIGGRVRLTVADQLVYHVEDGTMEGLGSGRLLFRIERSTGKPEEESHEV